MKRFTWLGTIALAIAVAAPASAQTRVGVIGGVNFSNLTGSDVSNTDSKTGFDVGVLAQMPLGMVLTFEPEAHYTRMGASVGSADLNLDYIQIPLLLKAGTPMAEGLDVHAIVGPYVGFLLKCDADGTDCKDGTKSTDYGLTLGGGFDWAMGSGSLIVEGRYGLGLAKLDDTSTNADIKNQNIQVLVGYSFTLGGM